MRAMTTCLTAMAIFANDHPRAVVLVTAVFTGGFVYLAGYGLLMLFQLVAAGPG